MAQIFVGDFGILFVITVTENNAPVDLQAVTNIQFIFVLPGTIIIKRTGVFSTNGADGKVQLLSQDGDFPTVGAVSVQVNLTFPDGRFRTSLGSFDVLK